MRAECCASEITNCGGSENTATLAQMRRRHLKRPAKTKDANSAAGADGEALP
jgi:hypothetical protein